MNYEEKYKEALSRATFYNNELPAKEQRKMLLDIFPELSEGEDERIRKAILELVKQSSEILGKQNQNNMIAWLEEQGEKKNTRKREIDDAYLQGICDAKHEIEKQGEQLDPDKVIEWLECKAFQGWAEEINIKQIVNKFKKDFEL